MSENTTRMPEELAELIYRMEVTQRHVADMMVFGGRVIRMNGGPYVSSLEAGSLFVHAARHLQEGIDAIRDLHSKSESARRDERAKIAQELRAHIDGSCSIPMQAGEEHPAAEARGKGFMLAIELVEKGVPS